MRDFPKWMIALAGINLLPLLASPFYLFGAVKPFGSSENWFLRLLLFVLANLIWLVPVYLFFVSLDFYRRGFRHVGIGIAVAGIAITTTCFALLS